MQKHFLHDKSGNKPQRERIFNLPLVIIVFFAVCCLAYIMPAYLLPPGKSEEFFAFFGFVPVLFLHNHDVMTQISAVSYSFLHGNFAHLGLNMVWFVVFGTPLANRLGGTFFILFWFFTAFIAAMIYCLAHFDGETTLIGASGAVSGMMGASARYDFQTIGGSYVPGAVLSIKKALLSHSVILVMGSFVTLNFLTAIDQWITGYADNQAGIAWEAHIGGLLAGFLVIGFFDKWTHNFKT